MSRKFKPGDRVTVAPIVRSNVVIVPRFEGVVISWSEGTDLYVVVSTDPDDGRKRLLPGRRLAKREVST